VTVQLVGPFSLDLQKPDDAARLVASALRAEWSRAAQGGNLNELSASKALPLSACPNLTAGVYGIWAPGDGPIPASLALWVTLDATWMEAGPAPGVEQLPLAGALLEALAEVQWWGDLDDATLRPVVVLEWPPALAVRSAVPPASPTPAPQPELPLDVETAQTLPPEDDDTPPEERSAAPTPPVVPVAASPAPVSPPAVSLPPARLDPMDEVNFWDDELTAAPPSPRPPPVVAPPPTLEALPDLTSADVPEPTSPLTSAQADLAEPETPNTVGSHAEAPVASPPRAPQVGLMMVMRAELVMRRGVHSGVYSLQSPSTDSADAPPRPLTEWLAAPEGPCLVPGDRVALPLPGWLSRELAPQPEAPDLTLEGRLMRRVVQRPWRVMAQDAAMSTFGVLLLAVVVAGGASLASTSKPAAAPDPVEPEQGPAISPCSADHAQFMEELRCQVAAMADPEGSSGPRCRDHGVTTADLSGAGEGDLRASYCGLLHREKDGWTGNFDDVSARGSRHNFAQLAASQACFNVLGHPDDYKQPQSTSRRLADPRRLLHDKTFRISSLSALVDELDERCDGYAERLEAKVRGAVFVTHVGDGDTPLSAVEDDADTRPCLTKGPEGERDCLRSGLAAVASRAVSSELRACFEHGVTSGVRWRPGEGLCGVSDAWSVASKDKKAWMGLAGSAARGAQGDDPLQRYVAARFDSRTTAPVSDALWSCHLDLQRGSGAARPVEVAWGLRLPIPARYELGGAGVGTQLLLDAALTQMDNEGVNAGRCWSVVRGQLAAYSPVHPLLEELDPARWVSTEQQLCAQVCAARYNVTPTEHDARWWTRTSDLGVCTSGSRPTPEALQQDDGLDVLQLPWNWTWYRSVWNGRRYRAVQREQSEDMGWQNADADQICAFHLAAQERITLSDGGLLSGERSGESWAGAALEGVRVAGGKDGAAVRAIRGLELEKNYAHNQPVGAYGQEVCADVATQCFTTIMLETMAARPRYQWVEGWQSEIRALPKKPIEDVFLEDPWCAAIHGYIDSSVQGILELPCTQGVQQAEASVQDALINLSRRGNP
jgi:hypothetical protein